MATIERIVQRVRERLDFPSPLPTGVILATVQDRCQHYLTTLRNRSNEGFLLNTFELVFSGNGAEPISAAAPDFEGAFLVVTNSAVYNDRREREVPVVRIQDRNYLVSSGNTLDAGGRQESLDGVSFYKEDSGWWAMPSPLDAQGYYVVWYEPSVATETAMQNSPQIPASFHQLLAVSAAVDLAGAAMWPGLDPEATAAKSQRILGGLVSYKGELEREWNVFIRQANAEHADMRRPFASEPGFWSYWRGGGF
jgi:hypothetical protein